MAKIIIDNSKLSADSVIKNGVNKADNEGIVRMEKFR